MSGWRRTLMMQAAQRQYIEGYCNVYNDTFAFYLTLRVGGTRTKVQKTVATDGSGYWRYILTSEDSTSLADLEGFATSISQAESDKLVKIKFSSNFPFEQINSSNVALRMLFGSYATTYFGCRNLTKIEGWKLNSTYNNSQAFVSLLSNCTSLYDVDVSNLQGGRTRSFTNVFRNLPCSEIVGLYNMMSNMEVFYDFQNVFAGCRNLERACVPSILNGTLTENAFRNCDSLTTIDYCGEISESLDIHWSPINLASAVLILQKLQDVTSYGGETLTFSSSTLTLIQASINNGDATTIAAVIDAIDNGWDISGLHMIYGQAVQVDGVYPATIQIRMNYNTYVTINVNKSTGYWIWTGAITSLFKMMFERNNCSSVKIYYRDATPISMNQLVRRSLTITRVDCSGVETDNLYFAFGLNESDYNNGYRSALQSIKLPIIRHTTADALNCCYNTRVLTDVEASFIESTITFVHSPLSLQSAINILNALQDVTSYGGATLTFSSTTKGYINNDPDALALVANAVNNLGWTIALN